LAIATRSLPRSALPTPSSDPNYIVDFASHRAKLVIEAGGGQHDEAVDAHRTAIIETDGYRVIRFWNNDILTNPEGVVRRIGEALE